MQNLEPILIFITVAEMGSFTHAADSLGIQKGPRLYGGPEARGSGWRPPAASDDAHRSANGGRTRISCPSPRSACRG